MYLCYTELSNSTTPVEKGSGSIVSETRNCGGER